MFSPKLDITKIMENKHLVSSTHQLSNQPSSQGSITSNPHSTSASGRRPPSGKPLESPLKSNTPNKARYKLALPHHPNHLGIKGANATAQSHGNNTFSLNIPTTANFSQ